MQLHNHEEPESFSVTPIAQSTNSGATRIQASETLTHAIEFEQKAGLPRKTPNYTKHRHSSMHMMRNQRGSRNNHRQMHNKPETMP